MINGISYDKDIVKSVFGVVIPRQFKTLKEQMEYVVLDSLKNDIEDTAIYDETLPLVEDLLGNSSPIPSQYLNQPKRRDTSLGGNDTINSYPQFHENDDIVYPFNAVGPNGNNGLGRVYNETIDSNQQIMHLSFGVPKFNDPINFYKTAISPSLSSLMNKGDSWVFKLSSILGSTVGFVLTLPIKPFIWTYKLAKSFFNINANKYYDFKPTMPLYYKLVNTSLAMLAVNMDLSSLEKEYEPTNNLESESESEYLGDYGNSEVNEIDTKGKAKLSNSTIASGVPNAFSNHGLDIFAILQKTEVYDRIKNDGDVENLDEEIKKLISFPRDDFHPFKDLISGFSSATTESKTYVGFKIEKSTDSSESFSNSVGASSISESVNGKVSSMKDTMYTAGGFNMTGMKTIKDALSGFFTGVTSQFGLAGIAEAVKGNGFLDFPEVWKNSSFSKSYNFTMQLRSIYGDRVSILYNIYIPLLMIFAGALPRAVGKQSYTSPFLVRAYSKGLMAIPMGIIDSLSVKRGSAEFGWSQEQYPTSVDVSFTIKDLSAALYMGISGTDAWSDVLGQNSSFQEYLLNLAGVSIRDRTLFSERIKRKAKLINLIARNVKYNPSLIGYSFGQNSSLGKVLTVINPISRLPD